MHLSRLAGRGGQLAWSRGVAFILAAVSGTSAYIPAQPTKFVFSLSFGLQQDLTGLFIFYSDTSQLSHSSE